MQSLAPKDYESLAALAAPAAYICVIRDIDSDLYRIDSVAHPAPYLEALMAEQERSFGFELVSILQTDDLAAAEAALYERYHARLGGDWLDLDEYQLEALRRSSLEIDAYASHYVTPQRPPYVPTPAKPLSRYEILAKSYYHGPEGMWRRRRRPPIPQPRYGASALKRRIEQAKRQRRRRVEEEEVSPFFEFAKLVDEMLLKRPRIILGILILLLTLCRMTFEAMPL